MMNKIPQAVDEILRQNHVGVLATVSSDGSPWATPLHFLYNGEQIAWFSPVDCVHSHNARQQSNVGRTRVAGGTTAGITTVAEMLRSATE